MNDRAHSYIERPDTAADALRVPPHSIEAEQSVLGGLLLDTNAWDRVGDLLAERDFYRHEHRLIYGAIGALVKASKPADVITVFERLQSLGSAEACGGMVYLNALAQSVPSASNIRAYGQIVRKASVRRAFIGILGDALENAWANDDVRKALDGLQTELGKLERLQVRKAPRLLSEILVESVDRISAIHDGTADAGWPTTIPWLDEMLSGGLKPGNFYCIAARPSVGKTSLVQSIGMSLAEQGLPTLMLSQEMPDREVGDRALCNIGRIDYAALQTGRLSDDDWGRLSEAVERGSRLPFYVDDQPSLRLGDIRTKARLVKGIKVLIVDYLQLCSGNGGRETRNAEIEEITRGLKALSKDMAVAVIVLSQLNRDVEKRNNKRPILADLRDSGAIEQDLDVAMLLWDVREFKAEGRKIVGLSIEKNRQGKRNVEVGLDFYGATQRWSESTADIRPDLPSGGRSFE